MPAPTLTRDEAVYEIAVVENALRDGFPAHTLIGSHGKSAVRVAADILGVISNSLIRRVGTPEFPTICGHHRRFGLTVDWSFYREPPRAAEEKDTTEIERMAERGLLGTRIVLPGFVIKKTSEQTGPDGELQHQWVEQRKQPGEQFELPDAHVIKGISALTDGDGRVLQRWIKTRTDDVTPDLVAALKHVFEEYDGRSEPVASPEFADSDLLSVYPIADQHNGLLAWGRETGDNYDLQIGSDRLRSSISRLIAQSPASHEGMILNLGDWQHSDDQKNMTPRSGNILDVDGRYFKVLTAGVRLMMDCIELGLHKHQHLVVRNIPGNHDPHASIALTVALSAFYSNNPRVTIDDDPSAWFFHRFGTTLIGATHGHRCKPADMAMTMAVRCREDWGLTKYHWMLYGHIHHESAKEVGDVRCESFQTLASLDAHGAGVGYSPGKSLTSVTIHKEDGEIGRHRVNIAPSFRSQPSTISQRTVA